VTLCDRGGGGQKVLEKKCDVFFEWPLTCIYKLYMVIQEITTVSAVVIMMIKMICPAFTQ